MLYTYEGSTLAKHAVFKFYDHPTTSHWMIDEVTGAVRVNRACLHPRAPIGWLAVRNPPTDLYTKRCYYIFSSIGINR